MGNSLWSGWRGSATLVRVIPFIIFVGLTAGQGHFGEGSRYWIYLAKTLLGAVLLWLIRPQVTEMRWKLSWEAVGVGVLVFGLWVGLDRFYPKWGQAGAAWNPNAHFGSSSPLAVLFVVVRIIGSSLVVPPLEEVFYRSYLYRYLVRPEFETVPLTHFSWMAFLVTSVFFGLVHYEWLAGILCGMLYQMLVIRHKRLGDAMAAHAITNFLLGVWVVWMGAWHFW
jgi:uncharacterized protein